MRVEAIISARCRPNVTRGGGSGGGGDGDGDGAVLARAPAKAERGQRKKYAALVWPAKAHRTPPSYADVETSRDRSFCKTAIEHRCSHAWVRAAHGKRVLWPGSAPTGIPPRPPAHQNAHYHVYPRQSTRCQRDPTAACCCGLRHARVRAGLPRGVSPAATHPSHAGRAA